jgi:hypothetical protein
MTSCQTVLVSATILAPDKSRPQVGVIEGRKKFALPCSQSAFVYGLNPVKLQEYALTNLVAGQRFE